MSASTSSEENVMNEPMAHDSDTADENESSYPQQDIEPKRKKQRTSSVDTTQDKPPSRPPKFKNRDTELRRTYVLTGQSRMRTPSSREPSRSRSDRSRSKSPSIPFPGARVGKRVRRKPQRWDGDRADVVRSSRIATATIAKKEAAEAKASDDDSTISVQSNLSATEQPLLDDPFEALHKARASCGSQPSRREIVDSFHSWQLQIVSHQAAQQKALHVYLKRKLRKRSSRAPDYDRLEDEALRSCRDPGKDKTDKPDDVKNEDVSAKNSFNSDDFVPCKIRLPLEAYLPRRVKPSDHWISKEEVLHKIPTPPSYPANTKMENGDQKQWLVLPTVKNNSSGKSNSTKRMATAFNSKETSIDNITATE